MRTSSERIITSHTGSLPRPEPLMVMELDKMNGKPVDEGAYSGALRDAVRTIVRKQAEIGLDVIDDGEQSKVGFIAYVNARLGGFEPAAGSRDNPFGGSKEHRAFPEFYGQSAGPGRGLVRMVARGPVVYQGQAQLATDLGNLKAALGEVKVADAFVPSATPASIESLHGNEYYPSTEAYLEALGEAMREEYRAIIEAGFILQLDDPIIATQYVKDPSLSVTDAVAWAKVRVDALNHALRDLPIDRIRHHTCYGINMGPRVWDIEFKHLIDLVLSVRASVYSFEAANPRHEHEWVLWHNVKLPEGKAIMPGVITQSSVLVEHPELVAQRIARFAEAVGKERVIAGSDCGFATNPAAIPEIHPSIAWAKLQALVDGARLASAQLWR